MDPFYFKYDDLYDTPEKRLNGFSTYWDLNLCCLEDGEDSNEILKNIEKGIKTVDENYFINRATVYGNFDKHGGEKEIFQGDRLFTVYKKHIPKRDPICRGTKECRTAAAAQRKGLMTEDINHHLVHNAPPYNILIISNDADYLDIVKELDSCGIVVFVGCDPQAVLADYALHRWDWNQMKKGEGPDRSHQYYGEIDYE